MSLRQILVLIGIYATIGIALCFVLFIATRPLDAKTLIRPGTLRDGQFSAPALRLYASFFGSARMLERYKNAGEQLTEGPEHRAGHVVGQVLYEREGLAALDFCSQAFTFGCLHQVVSQMLSESGAAANEQLVAVCNTKTGALLGTCAHAVGHGLSYVSEYDPALLEKNLQTCDEIALSPVDPVHSCYAGLLMEYNMRYVMYRFPNPRTPDEDPFAMCRSLSKPIYREICTFWIIPWLHAAKYEFAYSPHIITEFGNLCRSLDTGSERTYCFYGLGRTLTISIDMRPIAANEYCTLVGERDDDVHACMLWAARSYHLAEDDADAVELCKLMRSNENIRACVEFALAPTATP